MKSKIVIFIIKLLYLDPYIKSKGAFPNNYEYKIIMNMNMNMIFI